MVGRLGPLLVADQQPTGLGPALQAFKIVDDPTLSYQ